MLFTGMLVSRVRVDLEVESRTESLEGITRRLVRDLIARADELAYKVREESVHVRRIGEVDREFQAEYEAVWSPQGAILVGGEYDGDRITIRREDRDGYPLSILTLPYRTKPYIDNTAVPAVTTNPSYRREGIDPIEDVWVYKLIR